MIKLWSESLVRRVCGTCVLNLPPVLEWKNPKSVPCSETKSTALCCIVLYCIVLYCIVLYCIVLETKTIFMLKAWSQL